MIHHGFKPEPTSTDHYVMGQGKLTARYGALTLNPSGDWEKWLPAGEKQSNSVFEPYDCTVANALAAYETVANFLKFAGLIKETDFPKDCSERFNAICANIGSSGGYPFQSADSIRRVGVIPENVLPFNEKVRVWDEFYHPKPMPEEFKKLARDTSKRVHLQCEWLFNDETRQITLTDKKSKIQAALKRGVVCASVYAWKEKNGLYYKDAGDRDSHWTMLYRQDDVSRIFDTYTPFKKNVNQDFECAILYTMSPKTQYEIDAEERTLKGLMLQLIGCLQQYIKIIGGKLGFFKPAVDEMEYLPV